MAGIVVAALPFVAYRYHGRREEYRAKFLYHERMEAYYASPREAFRSTAGRGRPRRYLSAVDPEGNVIQTPSRASGRDDAFLLVNGVPTQPRREEAEEARRHGALKDKYSRLMTMPWLSEE